MHWSDRRAGARVFYPRPIRLHLRSERQQNEHLSLCLDSPRDAVPMNPHMNNATGGPHDIEGTRQSTSPLTRHCECVQHESDCE
jgi:hypothetical protein